MATTTAPSRRRVNYSSFDQLMADADRAVRDKAQTTGNWSLGRILEHLALANDKTIDGFDFKAPLPIRMIASLIVKPRVLKHGMKPGFQLSKRAAQGLIPDDTDPNAALEHLRRSVERLQSEPKRSPHPFFGTMSVDESNRMMLRHAELHMSFVR